jgi:hypothetical protein
LETLSLWSCEKITDTGVEAISRLPRMRHLELPEFADITDAGLKALAANSLNLEQLRLDHLASISDEGIGALARLRRLAKLTIESCERVTSAAIVALRHQLPDCRIIFS